MEIRIVVPAIQVDADEQRNAYARISRPETKISISVISQGPASIESAYDGAFSLPGLIAKIQEADRDGVDAVIIDCMSDPGLDAAREIVNIPVIGPAQSAFRLATMLAHKFSVITFLESGIPEVHKQLALEGMSAYVASVRAVEIPVLDIDDDKDRVVEMLTYEAEKAILEDGAALIIPYCTGTIGLAKKMEDRLIKKGIPAPVIDGPWAALKLAESLVDMGISHSKLTYPSPPIKEIIGYDNLFNE